MRIWNAPIVDLIIGPRVIRYGEVQNNWDIDLRYGGSEVDRNNSGDLHRRGWSLWIGALAGGASSWIAIR